MQIGFNVYCKNLVKKSKSFDCDLSNTFKAMTAKYVVCGRSYLF